MQRSEDVLENPSSTTLELINNWFPDESHPCRNLERAISNIARSDDIVLEISPGPSSPPLRKLQGFVGAVRGVDFTSMTNVTNASIDIAFCRRMVQPLGTINRYYSELFRTLRPGGGYVFLTPNHWGYEQIISRFTPHQTDWSITVNPGTRVQTNAVPTCYQSNTARSIKRLANDHGFTVEQLDYLNQSPINPGADHSPGSRYATLLTRHPMFRCLRGLIICTLKKKFMRDLF